MGRPCLTPRNSAGSNSRWNHRLTPDLRLASPRRATPAAPTRTAARHQPDYRSHRSRTGSFSPSRPPRNLQNLPDNPVLGPLTFAAQSAYDGRVRSGAPDRNPKSRVSSAVRFNYVRRERFNGMPVISMFYGPGQRRPRLALRLHGQPRTLPRTPETTSAAHRRDPQLTDGARPCAAAKKSRILHACRKLTGIPVFRSASVGSRPGNGRFLGADLREEFRPFREAGA